jgi:glycosyltransferase involved in cell wall biosynthesis
MLELHHPHGKSLPLYLQEGRRPLVTVAMPVHNCVKYLANAIDSILVQTFSDFELIIIDDGSTDNSNQVLMDYQKRDVRIRLIPVKIESWLQL